MSTKTKRAPCSKCNRQRGTYNGPDDGYCRFCRSGTRRPPTKYATPADLAVLTAAEAVADAHARYDKAFERQSPDVVRLQGECEQSVADLVDAVYERRDARAGK